MEQFQDQKPLRQTPLRWTFIWAMVTVFSIIAGYALIDALPEKVNDFFVTHEMFAVLLFGIFWGGFVGFFQWLLLRIRAAKTVWWIPLNAAGYTLMLLGVYYTNMLVDRYWDVLSSAWYQDPPTAFANIIQAIYGDVYLMDVTATISISIVFGLAIGLTQWLAMRMLQPLPPEEDPREDAAPPQTPLPPRRISAWWIPLHFLCTLLAGWMSYRTATGAMPMIFFFILYGLLSSIAFGPILKLLLPSAHRARIEPNRDAS